MNRKGSGIFGTCSSVVWPTLFALGALASQMASAEPSAPAENTAQAPRSRPASEPAPAPAQTEQAGPDAICQMLETAASDQGIPPDFFTRLIWQESRFDPTSVSRAGAQGMAQFMPRTAAGRGLTNPFDPAEALPHSAAFLHDLLDQFGNLGLAAAAYNGGPRRVQDWLLGRGELPSETRAYVIIVTGYSAEEWLTGAPKSPPRPPAEDVPCRQLVGLFPEASPQPATRPSIFAALQHPAKSTPRDLRKDLIKTPAKGVWGIQLAGAWTQEQALASYAAVQKRFASLLADRPPLVVTNRLAGHGAPYHRVRLAFDTRGEAQKLCGKLEAAGGSCIVLRN